MPGTLRRRPSGFISSARRGHHWIHGDLLGAFRVRHALVFAVRRARAIAVDQLDLLCRLNGHDVVHADRPASCAAATATDRQAMSRILLNFCASRTAETLEDPVVSMGKSDAVMAQNLI
jgi:hypothetical protein